MDPAEADLLGERLGSRARSIFDVIEVFPEIDSTNSYLLGRSPPQPGQASAVLAKQQTAGRGRLNNRWHSPPGRGLYLSVAYAFDRRQENIAGLTLAAGVAILRALEDVGVDDAMLKWPNDIVLNDGKLGGLLTELQPTNSDTPVVVIGAGLNIDMQGTADDIVAGIGRVADLREATGGGVDLMDLAAAVLGNLIDAVVVFDQQGLQPFVQQWRDRDWLADKAVRVESAAGDMFGVAAGIDQDGALLLQQQESLTRVISGTVIPDDGERP